MDVFSKRKRSHVMSRIRSFGNQSTENALAALFREARITGWRRHARLAGRPDFVFQKERLSIFVHGCFWHGCRTCYRLPEMNRAYWQQKIVKNMARDRRVARRLRDSGYSVLTIWECQLVPSRSSAVRSRIIAALSRRRSNLRKNSHRPT